MTRLIVEIDIDDKTGRPNMELLHLVASPASVPQDQLLRTLAYRLSNESHRIKLRWEQQSP